MRLKIKAKYEGRLVGDFEELVRKARDQVLTSSVSAHLEDESRFRAGELRVQLMIFERYSMTGENRLSLSLLLVEEAGGAKLSAIASGGSRGLFFKINTFGEEAFLDTLGPFIKKYS